MTDPPRPVPFALQAALLAVLTGVGTTGALPGPGPHPIGPPPPFDASAGPRSSRAHAGDGARPTPLAGNGEGHAGNPGALPTGLRPQTDLDAFMARVLARRDENWKKLQQYVLDERETVEVLGPGLVRIYGHEREYTWFVRQGYFVRSPLRVNGAAIGEAERRAYEVRWIAREQAREQRAATPASRAGGPVPPGGATTDTPPPAVSPAPAHGRRGDRLPAPAAGTPSTSSPDTPAGSPAAAPVPADVGDVLRQTLEPRFVSAAYFLEFPFEPGRYVFAGRETIGGHEVLRIEYYPARLFHDEDDRRRSSPPSRQPRAAEEVEERLERQMNKVALVTLWVEPRAHQIVRYTFENVGFDFLPGRWLVRVDAVEARMEMHEAFPDVWLPRGIDAHVAITFAAGTYDVRFTVIYFNYRQPDVKVRIR